MLMVAGGPTGHELHDRTMDNSLIVEGAEKVFARNINLFTGVNVMTRMNSGLFVKVAGSVFRPRLSKSFFRRRFLMKRFTKSLAVVAAAVITASAAQAPLVQEPPMQ